VKTQVKDNILIMQEMNEVKGFWLFMVNHHERRGSRAKEALRLRF